MSTSDNSLRLKGLSGAGAAAAAPARAGAFRRRAEAVFRRDAASGAPRAGRFVLPLGAAPRHARPI